MDPQYQPGKASQKELVRERTFRRTGGAFRKALKPAKFRAWKVTRCRLCKTIRKDGSVKCQGFHTLTGAWVGCECFCSYGSLHRKRGFSVLPLDTVKRDKGFAYVSNKLLHETSAEFAENENTLAAPITGSCACDKTQLLSEWDQEIPLEAPTAWLAPCSPLSPRLCELPLTRFPQVGEGFRDAEKVFFRVSHLRWVVVWNRCCKGRRRLLLEGCDWERLHDLLRQIHRNAPE